VFAYDPDILTAVQEDPQTISDVLDRLQTIDRLCVSEDGLKWFNGVYISVTQAVENRVTGGGFADPRWLAAVHHATVPSYSAVQDVREEKNSAFSQIERSHISRTVNRGTREGLDHVPVPIQYKQAASLRGGRSAIRGRETAHDYPAAPQYNRCGR